MQSQRFVVEKIPLDQAKRIIGIASRHAASPEEMRWIIPAIKKFREIYQGRPSEAAAAVGLPRASIQRWMTGGGYPGKGNIKRFAAACASIGIEVVE